MPLDVRLPIGGLFLALGAILAATGAWTGQRIDLGWGGIYALFGAVMLFLARRGRRRSK